MDQDTILRRIVRLVGAGLAIGSLAQAARVHPLDVMAVLADEPVPAAMLRKLARGLDGFEAVRP